MNIIQIAFLIIIGSIYFLVMLACSVTIIAQAWYKNKPRPIIYKYKINDKDKEDK